jgi:hypothetical protein
MSESYPHRDGEEPFRIADTAAAGPHVEADGPASYGEGPDLHAEDEPDDGLADDELDGDLTDYEPDEACELNDWLRDNWDTMHALARAGQLPDLEPPRFKGPAKAEEEDDSFPFDPVPIRARIDGWTAERQVAFIEALAECACVAEACRSVKMSKRSAYRLRARPEALSFRNAWDAALDYATRCLADEVLSRAVKGVTVPVFYQGEQIGERRTYDERLAMFLLQRRDPLRYGPWRDRAEWNGHPESQTLELLEAKNAIREDAALATVDLVDRIAQRLRSIVDTVLGSTRQREE